MPDVFGCFHDVSFEAQRLAKRRALARPVEAMLFVAGTSLSNLLCIYSGRYFYFQLHFFVEQARYNHCCSGPGVG